MRIILKIVLTIVALVFYILVNAGMQSLSGGHGTAGVGGMALLIVGVVIYFIWKYNPEKSKEETDLKNSDKIEDLKDF